MRKYKLRVDSTLGRLPAEQRERLDEWLFDEHVSHAEALERVRKEFGVTSSLTSVGRYYRWRREERAVEDLAGVDRTLKAMNGVKVNMASLRETSLKLIAKRLLDSALDGAQVADVSGLARILFEGEWRQIQRERLELAREKFHFNAAEAALAELPHAGEMTAEELEQEKKRVDGMVQRLFGKLLPAGHVPEGYVPYAVCAKGEGVKTGKREDEVLAHGHQEGKG